VTADAKPADGLFPRDFAWRRELPFVAGPAIVAFVVRVAFGGHLEAFMDADTGIAGLGARHIARGLDYPAFFYGNNYMGTTSLFLAALFHGGAVVDPRSLAVTQALLVALVLIPGLYRLAHALGGRWGASVACALAAVGTPEMLVVTSGKLLGYVELAALVPILYVVAERARARPAPGPLFALGFAAGFGYYTNPQVCAVLLPLALWAWARGRAARWLAGVWPDRPGRRWRPAAWGVVGGAGAMLVLCAVLAFQGSDARVGLGGVISLSRPERYPPRIALGLAILALALELWLAPRRGRGLALAACVLAGAAVGLAPRIAFDLGGGFVTMRPLIAFDAASVPENARMTGARLATMLWGDAVWPGVDAGGLGGVALAVGRMALAATWGLAVAGALVRRKGELVRLATLRPVVLSLESLLLLQVATLVGLVLLYPQSCETRYLLQLWIPLGGLVAAAAGRGGRRAAAYGALAMVSVLGLVVSAAVWIAAVLPGHPSSRRAVIASLDARGATRGYGDYFRAYELSYLSDERILVAMARGTPRMPAHEAAVAAEPMPFLVFLVADARYPLLDAPFVESGALVARWFGAPGARVLERWRVGPYLLARVDCPLAARPLRRD